MLKANNEQNYTFKRAILISVVLHIILFAVLIWSAFYAQTIDLAASASSESAGSGGSAIDAVMVTSGAKVQNYNRQQQQQQQQPKRAKRSELHEKAASKQELLKQLEKGRLQKQETAREQVPQTQQKQLAEVAKKAQQRQKEAAAETTKKATQEAEKKAVAKKAVAKKNAAEMAAAEEINNLFGELSFLGNALKDGSVEKENNSSLAESGMIKNSGASGADISNADISNYAWQIKSAIESRFYDALSYAGKTCKLRIKLAPEGMLLDVRSEGGDQALCTAALTAARQATIPKPPSQAVYEAFKNVLLDFKP